MFNPFSSSFLCKEFFLALNGFEIVGIGTWIRKVTDSLGNTQYAIDTLESITDTATFSIQYFYYIHIVRSNQLQVDT